MDKGTFKYTVCVNLKEDWERNEKIEMQIAESIGNRLKTHDFDFFPKADSFTVRPRETFDFFKSPVFIDIFFANEGYMNPPERDHTEQRPTRFGKLMNQVVASSPFFNAIEWTNIGPWFII